MFAVLTDREWLWAAGAFYLTGLILGTLSLIKGGRPSGVTMYAVITAGYLLQLMGLGIRGHAVGGCPLGNSFEIFQFTAWSAITLYLLIGVTFRSSLLGYFTSCLAAALTLSSLLLPDFDATRRAHIFGNNPWIEFHAAIALFSYGVFALLALTSALYLLRLYSLKSKRIGGWFSFLPSVIDLDQIGLRLLVSGVLILAISLIVGSVYWTHDFASVSVFKLIVTCSVWVAYSVALILRLNGKLIAKRFGWVGILLFVAALLSLWPVDTSRHSSNGAIHVKLEAQP